jgi:type III restriction enzyme
MIKLPVDLESRADWLEVLAAAHHRREDLERIADRATQEPGLPFIRPIALIQAQPSSRTKETHTVEKVKQALIEQLDVPADYVKICTGTIDEIGDTDLMETNCPIRYVITVDKLREGWDCPLAYVLGSIGNAATPTAVEQLIGRVLRMPFATPTGVPALDRAYAFVLSDDVVRVSRRVKPARHRRAKTSQLEKGKLRPTGFRAAMPQKETCYGECPQDGEYSGNTFVTRGRLETKPHRRGTRPRSRNRPKIPAATLVRTKTRKRADRLG